MRGPRHLSRLSRALVLVAALVYVASTEADRVLHLSTPSDEIHVEETHGQDCEHIHRHVGCPAVSVLAAPAGSTVAVRTPPSRRVTPAHIPLVPPAPSRRSGPHPVRGPPTR